MTAKQRRTQVRWARYVNHYAHVSLVVVGGRAASRYIDPFASRWRAVRRQGK